MRDRLVSLLVLLSLLVSSSAHAGVDWKQLIGQDRVKTIGGKMVIEEFQLCKVAVPGAQKSSIQMRSYAEAPINAGISRDFFVSFESAMGMMMQLAFGAELAKGSAVEPLEALDCAPIGAPIGKVDLEINLYLTAEGFQLEVANGANGQSMRESQRWEDLNNAK